MYSDGSRKLLGFGCDVTAGGLLGGEVEGSLCLTDGEDLAWL